MFRNMLRVRQQISKETCIEILKNEHRGILSVLGDDAYPYGVPLNHWYCEADGSIYFHCGKEGHKLDAVRKHEKASFCVYDQGVCKEGDWALNIQSVIVFGRIRQVEDPARAIEIVRRLSHKFTSDQNYIEREIQAFGDEVLCLELVPEHMTGKLVREA